MSRKCQPTFDGRLSTEADVTAVLNCLTEAFAPYKDNYTADAFLDTVLSPETIKCRMKSMKIFVAESQSTGKIVGTVACNLLTREEGHIRGMAVLPAFQGAGIAQQLLDHAEAELLAQKCVRITLDTTAPLKRAIRFYQRNGFRPSGRVTDFLWYAAV
jgi:ribosomal protein S18 acetylase RimI-like enzyme